MIDYTKKELIIFDKDGTITLSKSPLEKDIADLIVQLLAKKKVAIISGGSFPLFETQLLNKLPANGDHELTNLFLLPTSGTRLYTWRGSWHEQYAEDISVADKKNIMEKLNMALTATGYTKPQKIYGDLMEDRGSQITFSALGQNAPLEPKQAWDPTRAKREAIADFLKDKLPRFDVRIGGSTSIDITMKGVNKAYGIRKLEDFLHMPLDKMLFIGDTLFHGGNDYPAKSTGIDCIAVTGPQDAGKIIQDIVLSTPSK